jgi:hypothetical protein
MVAEEDDAGPPRNPRAAHGDATQIGGRGAYDQAVSVDSPEDLYGLPLDRFIPERAALVKALRGEKRREEASEVTALRKPSVAAWAVNQLVRTQPKPLEALFQAGDDLAQAQARATAGKGGGDAMRDATRRQRDAVRELLEGAEGLLSSEGHALSQTMMDRVGETLRAAAVDEEARRQVAGGCLTQELRFVGVGIGGLAPSSVRSEPGAKPVSAKGKEQSRGKGKGNTEQRSGAKTEVEKAARAHEAEAAHNAPAERKAARERAAALKAARRTEAETRRAATRAHKELAAAQARREAAVASLEEAETLLSAAARRAEEADARLTTVEQAVRDLAET